MSAEKSGWDKIAEQENASKKKESNKEKITIVTETTSNVSWAIFVVAVAVIAITTLAIVYLLK